MQTMLLDSSVLHLLLLSCLWMVATGRNVSLQPSDVRVDTGNWAAFNCTLPCDYTESHTINWFIGDSPISRRNVYLSQSGHAEREFEQFTGIEIELRDTSTCGTSASNERVARQQLRVLVDSSMVQRINRTAVQCAAMRKDPSFADLYSYYGVILVNGDLEMPTMPVCTSENRPTQNRPAETTHPPTIEPSTCLQHTVTVTQTQTVTVVDAVPTQLPSPARTSHTDLTDGSLKRTASLLLILSLVLLLPLFL